MKASPIQEDALHAALHRIIEDRESYSPAGLASEVVRTIESECPQFNGSLSAVVDDVLCNTLTDRLARFEADPTNRLIAAARKLSEAREETAHAEIACAVLEDELCMAAAALK